MGKRRRKKARKVFPAKFNAGRVHVGQSVDTFKTSTKTGAVKTKTSGSSSYAVYHYRARGDPWLGRLQRKQLEDLVWPDGPTVSDRMQDEIQEAERQNRFTRSPSRQSVLAKLDEMNNGAIVEHHSWRRQSVKHFHFKVIYDNPRRILRLYISRDEYFYVEENYLLGVLRRSIGYGSEFSAEWALKNHKIAWIETEPIPTPPPE